MRKRLISFALMLCIAFGAAGCGGTNIVTEDVPEVEIYLLEAGYRTEFMDEWIKAFNKKYPDITVTYTPSSGATEKAVNDIRNVKSTVDIWFTGWINIPRYVAEGGSVIKGYDCIFEDLTDLLDQPIEGEGVSIREKADDRVMLYNTVNGRNYSLSWASGPSGLLVNRGFGLEVPKTTDGFISQVKSIANGTAGIDGDVKPFIWPGSNAPGYWDYLMDTWKAQYDGIEGYDAYWRFGYEGESPTYEVLHQNGVLESYKVLDALSDQSYSVYESPQLSHTDAQQSYLRGAAVYMPSGDWFETEMKSTGINADIVMAKIPVISALGQKLRLAGTDASYEENEAKLVEIVTDIDEGLTLEELKEKHASVGADKVQEVWNARHVAYNTGYNHIAYIPAFSNAKTASKKYLQFICSDEGIAIFRKYAGWSMPYDYEAPEDEVRTEFQKSMEEVMKDTVSFFPTKNWTPLRYIATPIADSACWLNFYNNEKTPQEVYDDVYNYSRTRWPQFLIQAGLA